MGSRDSGRRFHFLREIASGGFGSVYLAKVMHADGFSRLVAIKLLKEQWADTDEVAKRTRDEAKLLGLLRHRNIVDVIDRTSIEGRVAILMEYIEAIDLRDLIDQHRANHREVPLRPVLEILHFAAGALDAAYNRPPSPGEKPLRVIHRDIKPSNIMVDGTGLVKVLDFGVARSDLEDREGRTQELQFGSVDYMSPERLFFEPDAPAGDVYSMGATLFEILALELFGKAKGRREQHAEHVQERLRFLAELRGWSGRPEFAEVEPLLEAALAYDAHVRPTAAEFGASCRAIARKLQEDDLASWAERELPELIRLQHEKPRAKSELDDSVLSEDSIVIRRPSAPAVVLETRSMTTLDGLVDRPYQKAPPETVIPEVPDHGDVDPGLDEVVLGGEVPDRPVPTRGTMTSFEAEPVPSRGVGTTPWVAIVGVGALMLGLLTVVVVVGIAVGVDSLGTSTAPDGPTAISPTSNTPTKDPPPTKAEFQLEVVSADPKTQRVQLRCVGGEASGVASAGLMQSGAALGTCTVTAFLANHDRRSALLNAPEAGAWRCFEGASDVCAHVVAGATP